MKPNRKHKKKMLTWTMTFKITTIAGKTLKLNFSFSAHESKTKKIKAEQSAVLQFTLNALNQTNAP